MLHPHFNLFAYFNLGIALSYFVIPVELRSLKKLALKYQFSMAQEGILAFELFIMACGTGHLIHGLADLTPAFLSQMSMGLMLISDGVTFTISAVTAIAFPYILHSLNMAIRNAQQDKEDLIDERILFEAIAEGTNDGIWDWRIDEDAIYLSPRWKQILGFSDDELPNQVDEWHSRIHPSDLDRVWIELEEHLSGRKPIFACEYKMQCKNGNYIWVSSRAITLKNDAGHASRIVGSYSDITRRKRAEQQLKEIEDRYFSAKELAQITLESIGDAVIRVTPDLAINYMNPVAEYLTGWPLEEAFGKPINEVFSIFHEITGEVIPCPVANALTLGRTVTIGAHTNLRNRHGNIYAIADSTSPVRDVEGDVIGLVLVFRDTSAERILRGELAYQASHDSLTRLPNRREFETQLEKMHVIAQARNQASTLCILDLDGFKLINDLHGHHAGDELLKGVSEAIHSQVRVSDVLARLGGDEFGLILSGCPIENAEIAVSKVHAAVLNYRLEWAGKKLSVGVSVGVVELTPETIDLNHLMVSADTACYLAKNKSGNHVHYYSEGDNLAEGAGLVTKALEEDRFILFTQPIRLIGQKNATHHELLLRMSDRQGNILAPAKFMKAAERYKLMPQIDRWVISSFISHLSQLHLGNTEDVYALNVSGATLNDGGFAEFVEAQFAAYPQVLPKNICFEITESVAVSNLARTAEIIRRLKARGVKFALDDFGAGCCSLSYLQNLLQVDFLKIDGTFISEIARDTKKRAIVETIARLGAVFEMQTIAEWVEDAETEQVLKSIGVHFAQGYFVGRPGPLVQGAA